MSTQTFEDELTDARIQAKQDLLDGLHAAGQRMRDMVDAGSAIGIREAAEAILTIEKALEKLGV